MKTIVIAAVTLAALIGAPAVAADMAAKAPPPAYAPASLANWCQCRWRRRDGQCLRSGLLLLHDSTLHGGFAELGGQAGYNWQFGPAIVGIEGDLNWQSFDRTSGVIATVETTKTKLDASASVRLRAGLAFDRTLAYVTSSQLGAMPIRFRRNSPILRSRRLRSKPPIKPGMAALRQAPALNTCWRQIGLSAANICTSTTPTQ